MKNEGFKTGLDGRTGRRAVRFMAPVRGDSSVDKFAQVSDDIEKDPVVGLRPGEATV